MNEIKQCRYIELKKLDSVINLERYSYFHLQLRLGYCRTPMKENALYGTV